MFWSFAWIFLGNFKIITTVDGRNPALTVDMEKTCKYPSSYSVSYMLAGEELSSIKSRLHIVEGSNMMETYDTFEGFVRKIVRCFGLVIMTPVEYKYHEFKVLVVAVQKTSLKKEDNISGFLV